MMTINPNGFSINASKILPSNSAKIDLVVPQDGQGIFVMFLKTQTLKGCHPKSLSIFQLTKSQA
jgi:hypothetical protein